MCRPDARFRRQKAIGASPARCRGARVPEASPTHCKPLIANALAATEKTLRSARENTAERREKHCGENPSAPRRKKFSPQCFPDGCPANRKQLDDSVLQNPQTASRDGRKPAWRQHQNVKIPLRAAGRRPSAVRLVASPLARAEEWPLPPAPTPASRET